jgi:hypothetical protein
MNQKLPSTCLFAAALALFYACAEDTGSAESANTSQPDSGAEGGALYAMATAVTDDTGSNTYVKVFSELDGELDLGSAREFPGWSDMGAVGRYLFVSSGEAPTVWRFTIGDDGELVDDGELSFGSYVGDANFYNQTLISETQAYLVGEGEYVVWNPTSLEITGTFPFPELPDREGIPAYVALDRGAVVRDDRLYHAVAWSDAQELHMMPDSRIVVIDLEANEVVDVHTVPCPDLAVADRDEEGNLYFSNWVYSPGYTLLRDGVPACAVRIPAGSEELDESWQLAYAETTDHEGAVVNYLGEDKWLFSSFLNDPAIHDPEDDWFDWLFGDHWQLSVLDPETMTITDVEGAPRNGGGYYASRIDGTTHVLIPGDGYTTTAVYAIGDDGAARKQVDANGWATRLFRVR